MSAADDIELLRRYEPVLVFSPDERFFPAPVEAFVRESRLWSVPVKLGNTPLVRTRWKRYDPKNDLAGAFREMTSDRASEGFVYLEFVDERTLFPLFGQAWPLIAIETGFTLLLLNIILWVLLSFGAFSGVGWLGAVNGIIFGVVAGLVVGGIAVVALRRLLLGSDAFSKLPSARLRSFQTLATLALMLCAIVLLFFAGPLVIFVRRRFFEGVALWVVAWVLAYIVASYIPRFFRSGILQLSSLFAIISGLQDGTSDAAHQRSVEAGIAPRPGSDERTYPYYGRIWPPDAESRETYQYVALQYWFFYVFNDWRTHYNGIDDHEGDWEHVTVILSRARPGARLRPIYVVYSQHILPGAYLRRAWNDPGVVKVDVYGSEHPVAYVAAGSHAHYYRRGRHGLDELLRSSKSASKLYDAILRNKEKGRTQVDTELADVQVRGAKMVNLGVLGQYLVLTSGGGLPEFERMDIEEFVDYAGVSPSDPLSTETGPSIGPGQAAEWECVLIDEQAPDWMRYNGNWGKYVAYFGESAPRGPRFASKLSNRAEWSNPVDAAGLIPQMLEALQ